MNLSRQVSINELQDLEGLQAALDTLSGKLALPYLSRRSGTMQCDPIQELASVLEELNARERELQAAIGISKFLLERGKELKGRKEYYAGRSVHLEEQQANFQNELQAIRRDWQEEREKREELAREIASLELQVTHLSSENRDLKEQIYYKAPERHSANYEVTEIQLCEARDQNNELRRNPHTGLNEALQRRLNEVESANMQLENDQTQLQIDLRKAKFDYDKQRERTESQSQACHSLSVALKDQQQQCSSLQFKLAKAQAELELLSADSAHLSEAVVPTFSRKRTHSRHFSLVNEIKRLEDDESDSLFPRVVRPYREEIEEQEEEIQGEALPSTIDEELFTGNRSVLKQPPAPVLQIAVQQAISLFAGMRKAWEMTVMQQVDIPPVPIYCTACKKKRYTVISPRRDPLEEYFLLVSPTQATQAVKLNSPHIDSICTVAPEALYTQAITEKIPFQHVSAT